MSLNPKPRQHQHRFRVFASEPISPSARRSPESIARHSPHAPGQLQAVSHPSTPIYFTLDGQGTILSLTTVGCAELGYDSDALMRQSIFTLVHESDRSAVESQFNSVVSGSLSLAIDEWRLLSASGTPYWVSATLQTVQGHEERSFFLACQAMVGEVDLSRLTRQRQMEETLRENQRFIQQILETTPNILYLYDLAQQQTVYSNQSITQALGYSDAESATIDEFHLIHPDDWEMMNARYDCFGNLANSEVLEREYRVRHADGEWRWFYSREIIFTHAADGTPEQVLGTAQDITQRKRAEEAIRKQAESERLMGVIAQHIRQSLDLKEILQTTATDVREILQADRVVIFRVFPNGSGRVTTEALAPGCPAIIDRDLPEEIFPLECYAAYQSGRIRTVTDIESDQLSSCLIDSLNQLGVKSKVVVPIRQTDHLWGLLIAHQCTPRQWQPLETDLLKQLAAHLEIAIQHSEVYQQVQRLNIDLERQIQLRTAQLQLAFNFEETLKRITDKVRDSLDENQILQTAVRELALVTGISGCNAALYDLGKGTSTICYEYTTTVSPYQGRVVYLNAFPEIYGRLLQGESLQFCSLTPNPGRGHVSMLCSPIMDDQGVLGDLWLINQKYYAFSEQDIRLVHQVANQCAIAIRQARLFQRAQAQVEELEKLNQLKDDFLSTVSHELRTPMSSIKMATQMLEIILKRSGLLDDTSNKSAQYLQILHQECERETNLINDLLDLSRLDTGSTSLTLSPIDLKTWLPQIVQPFLGKAQSQEQQLIVDLPSASITLTTDSGKLNRILTELLTNACKYTPAHQDIRVRAFTYERSIRLQVVNSGVEISPDEIAHVFDKFYRIPKNDPWKHGGTGLGLALVKKLIHHLNGAVWAESSQGQVCFTVELPFEYDLQQD